ncbi:MAG: Uma2 family endonuclease [Saprospiraceae bacterium]
MEVFVETSAPATDYEIERGKPMPSTHHSFVQSNLIGELRNRYRDKFTILPELNLDESKGAPSMVPDIAIYPKFKIDVRQPDVIKRKDMPLAVVEILSPRQAIEDLIEKAGDFLRAGVQSVWVVVPRMAYIAVYRTPEQFEMFLEPDVLKDPRLGIELPLESVFQ